MSNETMVFFLFSHFKPLLYSIEFDTIKFSWSNHTFDSVGHKLEFLINIWVSSCNFGCYRNSAL